MQEAYWAGRKEGQPLGGIGCQGYMEFDGKGIDVQRLRDAVLCLTRRHEMLRARFLPEARQQILATSPWVGPSIFDLRAQDPRSSDTALELLRARLSRQPLDVAVGEVFAVSLTLLRNSRTRLHFQFDLLSIDGRSVQIFFQELAHFYQNPDKPLPPLGYTFEQYLTDCRARLGERRARAKSYWTQRLNELPGSPALPLARQPETVLAPRFTRRTHILDPAAWQALGELARQHSVTRAMALATAYAEVLGRWSGSSRHLLNVPHFGRVCLHRAVNHMIGDFSNLVPVAVDLSQRQSFGERARALQRTFRSGAAHATYHGIEVLRDLQRRKSMSFNPAPVVFTYNVFNAFGDDTVPAEFRKILGHPTFMITQTPQVWIDHQVWQQDGQARLIWDYVDDLFPDGMIDDMASAQADLVDRLTEDELAWQAPADVSLPPHQRALRRKVNNTAAPHATRMLHRGFFEHAEAAPQRPALFWGTEQHMTYGQLAEQALRVAQRLRQAGVRPGEPVAFTAPKGPDQVVAVLGILASSATYLPLSGQWPLARQRRVLQRAGTRFVLNCGNSAALLPGEAELIGLDEALACEPLAAPVYPSAESAAYVLFTSGSTGTPKGVEVPHQAACNTIEWVNRTCGIGADDRGFALSAMEFDLSVYDVFGLLSAGGALVIPSEEARRDAEAWWDLIRRHRVTTWNSVPVLLELLLTAGGGQRLPEHLRTVLLSGDWISPRLARLVKEAASRRCRFLALGGPTETAIWSNAFQVEEVSQDWTSVPYGFPLSNQQHRVVDEQGLDCPNWVPGELWVSGICVANGYIGDPERTEERFVVHNGQRWYKTGDLVRYRPDGALEILGRTDFQVKVNGNRVELGDIDAALRQIPDVTEAVTVALKEPSLVSLVSYLLTSRDVVPLESVRNHLAATLPPYSLPSRILILEELPMTPNGKVDRAALTAWAGSHTTAAPRDTRPPQPGIEAQLAELWEEVLGQQISHRSADFFLSGGNSVLAIRLTTQLRKRFNAQWAVRDVYSAPTLEQMAAQLHEQGRTPPDLHS
ncbi:amino acid adenylation domain-containing protein [Streptomyces sp. NPDC059680]|uniref:non-ribosomal peptide synthetase n=1 Tax=Streptomyces sp. NPDC059680 TaxID=3346904 RepID=UPI0036AC4855